MNAALDLDDLTRLSQAPLDAMAQLGASLELGDQSSRETFARQVVAVQALLKQTYQPCWPSAQRTVKNRHVFGKA